MIRVSKSSILVLVILLTSLVGCCLLIAFLVNDDAVQRWMLFGTFFFGFGSLCVSMSALAVSIKSYVNVEKEKQIRIKKEAETFISSYDDEIDLLPLCVIANSFARLHKFSRTIYNAFNKLDPIVQKEVLNILNVDYQLIDNSNWIDNSLKKVKNFIEKYELGRDVLYDNAKYYRSMFMMPDVEYSFEAEFKHAFPDQAPIKNIYFKDGEPFCDNVSFFDYLRQYVIFKYRKDPLIIGYKNKPIDYYCNLFGFSDCSSEDCAMISVNIVDSVAHIMMEMNSKNNSDVRLLPVETTHITKYEDRFLQSLSTLYDLSKYNFDE